MFLELDQRCSQPDGKSIFQLNLKKSMLSSSASSDVAIQPGPTDSVSEVSFCPTAEFFAVSSWDNAVRVYQVLNGQASPKTSYQHEGPAMCVTWSQVR